MDTLHSAVFYVFAAVAIAGALVTALARSRELAAAGLVGLAFGTALVLVALSGGFAAIVVVVLLLGAGAVASAVPTGAEAPSRRADNLGAVVAALLFIALAYAAYRGAYHPADYPGGTFNAAALGRLLVGRDALAVIALAAAALIGAAYVPAQRRSRRG